MVGEGRSRGLWEQGGQEDFKEKQELADLEGQMGDGWRIHQQRGTRHKAQEEEDLACTVDGAAISL